MNYLIIYAHPNTISFNHAIRETIADELKKGGGEVRIRDLYGMGFDPVLRPEDFSAMQKGTVREDVREEQEQLRMADVLVVIYPLWWAGMPAILKGYFDRIFTEEFAYRLTEESIEGLLTGKKVFLVTTTGASKEDYEESGFFRSMAQTIDMGIFEFCGLELIGHTYLSAVPYVNDGQRKDMLEELRATVRSRLL